MAVDAPSGLFIPLFLAPQYREVTGFAYIYFEEPFFSVEGKGKLAISALVFLSFFFFALVFLKGVLNSSSNVNRKALYPVSL